MSDRVTVTGRKHGEAWAYVYHTGEASVWTSASREECIHEHAGRGRAVKVVMIEVDESAAATSQPEAAAPPTPWPGSWANARRKRDGKPSIVSPSPIKQNEWFCFTDDGPQWLTADQVREQFEPL